MRSLASELDHFGYAVYLPNDEKTDYQSLDESEQVELKQRFIDEHFTKIRDCDAVLIANYEKHGIPGYVGANTLMELAYAYALNKQINVLYPPGEQGCRLEVLALDPLILNGNIKNLSNALT